MAAMRRGMAPEEVSRITGIDPWFTRAFNRIANMEQRLLSETLNPHLMWQAKRLGFGDEKIAILTDRTADATRKLRRDWDIRPVYKMVDTCAAEFEAQTPYFYSTYEQENEAIPIQSAKAVVLGSGPIRIGQGIEFDYCSVHAAWALQEEGIKSVMANSNPETVSTDFDTSDRLYFEPLDEESVRDILENESILTDSNDVVVPPTMVQFGGQTAINLSQSLDKANLPILGSTAQSIDIASDRHLFEEFLARVGIPNPPGAAVTTLEQALNVAQDIGYPALVRPSYVLGGRAMEIVQNATELVRYMGRAFEAGLGRRVLIDKYFEGREVEVDAVCDGETVLIPGIMEHVERAGVHSGDSIAIYPGLTLSESEVNAVVDYTTRIGLALDIRGLMNIQYPGIPQSGDSFRKQRTKNASLRDRGQSSFQPDNSIHIQSDWGSNGQIGDQNHAWPEHQRPRIQRWIVQAAKAGRSQGSGVLDVQTGRRRHLSGARNEVHRGGHGHRLRISPRIRQGIDGCWNDSACRWGDFAEYLGPRQV